MLDKILHIRYVGLGIIIGIIVSSCKSEENYDDVLQSIYEEGYKAGKKEMKNGEEQQID